MQMMDNPILDYPLEHMVTKYSSAGGKEKAEGRGM